MCSQYNNYFNIIIDKLNTGAVILSDNVLWSGKVLDTEFKKEDTSTPAIIEYNKVLKDDSRIETVIFPIRDGLTISRKL